MFPRHATGKRLRAVDRALPDASAIAQSNSRPTELK